MDSASEMAVVSHYTHAIFSEDSSSSPSNRYATNGPPLADTVIEARKLRRNNLRWSRKPIVAEKHRRPGIRMPLPFRGQRCIRNSMLVARRRGDMGPPFPNHRIRRRVPTAPVKVASPNDT
jgi:hypothetical protein